MKLGLLKPFGSKSQPVDFDATAFKSGGYEHRMEFLADKLSEAGTRGINFNSLKDDFRVCAFALEENDQARIRSNGTRLVLHNYAPNPFIQFLTLGARV